MRGAMAVRLPAQPVRIANEVVLGARAGISVQQPKPDRPVVDLRLGLLELKRRQIIKREGRPCVTGFRCHL